MNSQGYTKDNIHKGNTKIVAGGIDVDGLIRVGDQSASGNGYVLPETKGTIGQVITMNADNTTSFQDVGGDVATGRLIQNFFQMTNPTTSFNPSNFRELYTNSNGSDVITTADIEVGSSVRFRTKGYLYNGNLGFTALGQFRLRIGVPNTSSTFDFYSSNSLFIRDVGMSAGDPNVGRGWWEINVTVTKVDASNNCTIGVSGLYNCVASTGVTSDTFDIQFYDNDTTFTTRLPNNSSSNTVIPVPFWSALPATFQLELAWKQIAFDANAIATEYTIDYLNTGQEVLATTTAPATDHNTLANLNVGDPHQNYAILGGRSGGQVLSGGITPANFLTLKSHTAGANNMIIKDLNTTFEKNLQIGTNKILDTLNNSIDFIGGDMNLLNTSLTNRIVIASQNVIDVLANSQIKLGVPNASNNIVITSTDTSLNQVLNMNNNNIDNVNQVSSSGTLTLLGALGNRCDIGVAGATRLEVEDTRVFISQFADLNIQDKILYVQPNTMPPVFTPDTVYIFVGSRNTSNSYVLPANVKICGLGKNDSFINFNGGGTLFSAVDENLSVADITLTSSNNTGKLFDLTNAPQDKTINMKNLQIRNAKNGMSIVGYDLVDLNNCIFTYFESGSPTPVGVSVVNCSKLQLSSCEFLRWFQEGGTPATTFFNGNMLNLSGTLNALNLTGSFFHPQYDQNGIDTTFLAGVIEGTISSNTFIDINLNTGGGFQVLNLNPTIAPSYVVEGNSIYPNLRSQVTYVLSATNTTPTDLSVNNPNALNTGGLAIGLVTQFATLTTAGLITYLKKRSGNFIITASANLQVVAGGANQQVGLGLRVNGVDVPLAYSYITLDSAGTEPKQCTLNFTGLANQNDTFELTIFNASGNNNVIASYVNFAGIEI